MKSFAAAALLAAQGPLRASAEVANPISRVVGLLQGLRTKLEADMEAEESIFEKYVCWYKAIVESKTASNSAAESRIESLKSYVADIEAGRVTFTTEQKDLTKQVEGLRKDLQELEATRKTENEDYVAASAEMTKAITALTGAIAVIEDAAPSKASMLSVRSFRSRQSLLKALQLGQGLLGGAEVRYIESLVNGEVPQPDWKKLNRKATFKNKYNSRTGDISKTLRGMNDTFSANLAEAEQKEVAAQATYDELHGAKSEMLAKAEKALVDLVEENGAKGLSKQEALAEIDSLSAQVTADKSFIQDAEAAHAAKQKEWQARLELRQKELKAISEAISVLHSDDARDTFTKSYAFVETRVARRTVDTLLQKAMVAASGTRGASVLQAAAASGTRSIQSVIQHIDVFLQELASEEEADLKTKDSCEKERGHLTRQAKLSSVAIDGLTEEIVQAKAKAEEIAAQIKEQTETTAQLQDTVSALVRQREDENKQYVSDKADDQKAVELIDKAIAIFEKLQVDMKGPGGATLIRTSAKVHSASRRSLAVHAAFPAASAVVAAQTGAVAVARHAQPYEIKAGEAPPPPPATWEGPNYGGAEGESNGIMSILALVKEDIEADIAKADSDEQEAQSSFEKEKGELEASITAAEATISQYEGEQAAEEKTVVDKTGERATETTALEGTMKQIESLKPGCDFLLINYEARVQKRQLDMDGLQKAKAILQGGRFD